MPGQENNDLLKKLTILKKYISDFIKITDIEYKKTTWRKSQISGMYGNQWSNKWSFIWFRNRDHKIAIQKGVNDFQRAWEY